MVYTINYKRTPNVHTHVGNGEKPNFSGIPIKLNNDLNSSP
jgi:hypothetical protein